MQRSANMSEAAEGLGVNGERIQTGTRCSDPFLANRELFPLSCSQENQHEAHWWTVYSTYSGHPLPPTR